MIYIYEGPPGLPRPYIIISDDENRDMGSAKHRTTEKNGDIVRYTYVGIKGNAPKFLWLNVHSYDTDTAYMLTAKFVEAKDEV